MGSGVGAPDASSRAGELMVESGEPATNVVAEGPRGGISGGKRLGIGPGPVGIVIEIGGPPRGGDVSAGLRPGLGGASEEEKGRMFDHASLRLLPMELLLALSLRLRSEVLLLRPEEGA